jgi:hypothetical protein
VLTVLSFRLYARACNCHLPVLRTFRTWMMPRWIPRSHVRAENFADRTP